MIQRFVTALAGTLASIFVTAFLLTSTAAAQESPSYHKTEKLLPGEEVVTPTGQKMKVWSTEGPVPVSKAPQPFQDEDDQKLENPNIIIDAEDFVPARKNNPRQ